MMRRANKLLKVTSAVSIKRFDSSLSSFHSRFQDQWEQTSTGWNKPLHTWLLWTSNPGKERVIRSLRKATVSFITTLCTYVSSRRGVKQNKYMIKKHMLCRGKRKTAASHADTEVNTALWSACQLIFRGLRDEKNVHKTTTELVFHFNCGSCVTVERFHHSSAIMGALGHAILRIKYSSLWWGS